MTGIPFDTATTNRPGTRFGAPRDPRGVVAARPGPGPYGWNVNPMTALAIADCGDCTFDFGRPETVPDAIEAHARAILEAGPALLSLGGDHFVSYPPAQGARGAARPALARAFRRPTATPGRTRTGASITGPCSSTRLATGSWTPRARYRWGSVPSTPTTRGFRILDAPWVHAHGEAATAAAVRETVGDRPVYLTFDIDCLDPCFAPGTGTPVVGGLSTAQARAILRALAGLDVVGADLVEVAPPYDVAGVTAARRRYPGDGLPSA